MHNYTDLKQTFLLKLEAKFFIFTYTGGLVDDNFCLTSFTNIYVRKVKK